MAEEGTPGNSADLHLLLVRVKGVLLGEGRPPLVAQWLAPLHHYVCGFKASRLKRSLGPNTTPIGGDV